MRTIRRILGRWRYSWLRSKLCPWRYNVDVRMADLERKFVNLQNSTITGVQGALNQYDKRLEGLNHKTDKHFGLLTGKLAEKADEASVGAICRQLEMGITPRIQKLESKVRQKKGK